MNGKLSESQLHEIPGGRLSADAAKAWLDMSAEIVRKGGPRPMPGGPDSSYRTYDRQVYWRIYWAKLGQPQKAAIPGTSNHGEGEAVDVPDAKQQEWVREVGPKYGWVDDEGQAVGEAWHFTYVGRPEDDDVLTDTERRLVDEYKRLKANKTKLFRRRILRAMLVAQRKRIWRAAQKSGWDKRDRRKRYEVLKRATR